MKNPAETTPLRALPDTGTRKPLARIEHTTLADKVYVQLRDALRRGQWEMGQSLTLRGLAEMLGVSPMPVRDAVTRLVNEGVLESLANRQVRVPLLTVGQYIALTEARVAAEGHAAFLAAQRIDEVGLAAIAGANKRLAAATRKHDHAAIMQANQDVHFGIYRAARSDALMQIIESLWQQSGPYLATIERQMALSPSMREHDFGAEQHDRIYDALARRDGQAAQQMLVADIESFAGIYRELLLAADSGAPREASQSG